MHSQYKKTWINIYCGFEEQQEGTHVLMVEKLWLMWGAFGKQE